jgi:8-oxo-dGTP pyrophosphatase MutT (NUDIX family)
VLEETGWAPGPLTPIVSYHPSAGLMDQTFDLFLADGAREEGPPSDPSESERVEWVALDEVRRAVAAGEVTDGMSLTGLLWFLAVGAS